MSDTKLLVIGANYLSDVDKVYTVLNKVLEYIKKDNVTLIEAGSNQRIASIESYAESYNYNYSVYPFDYNRYRTYATYKCYRQIYAELATSPEAAIVYFWDGTPTGLNFHYKQCVMNGVSMFVYNYIKDEFFTSFSEVYKEL